VQAQYACEGVIHELKLRLADGAIMPQLRDREAEAGTGTDPCAESRSARPTPSAAGCGVGQAGHSGGRELAGFDTHALRPVPPTPTPIPTSFPCPGPGASSLPPVCVCVMCVVSLPRSECCDAVACGSVFSPCLLSSLGVLFFLVWLF
jgi:hypothetical protein